MEGKLEDYQKFDSILKENMIYNVKTLSLLSEAEMRDNL
jgi:hypothetical protein